MLENDIAGHAARVGAYLHAKLEEFVAAHAPATVGTRGAGLLQALQFDQPIARAVVTAANGEGVLLNPVLPNTIRFMPALIITEADVDECLAEARRRPYQDTGRLDGTLTSERNPLLHG